MSKNLSFGAILEMQDIDLSGMLGYSVSAGGKESHYILQRDEDGNYERKPITKELYLEIQKAKNVKN